MTEDQAINQQPQTEINLESVEVKPEVEKSKKTWTCPDCGNTYTYKYKYSHESHCHGQPKLKDIQKATQAAKELDSKPKKQLLSNLIRPEATLKETAPIEEEVEPPLPYVDDKRLNFYLQIAIVVGVVVTGLWVVYRSIINQPGDQAMPQQEIDLGFTDHRGVYYGPGEYHH